MELDGISLRKARAAARDALGRVGILELADEPTGALDSTTSEAVLRTLCDQCDEGAAGLLATPESLLHQEV